MLRKIVTFIHCLFNKKEAIANPEEGDNNSFFINSLSAYPKWVIINLKGVIKNLKGLKHKICKTTYLSLKESF